MTEKEKLNQDQEIRHNSKFEHLIDPARKKHALALKHMRDENPLTGTEGDTKVFWTGFYGIRDVRDEGVSALINVLGNRRVYSAEVQSVFFDGMKVVIPSLKSCDFGKVGTLVDVSLFTSTDSYKGFGKVMNVATQKDGSVVIDIRVHAGESDDTRWRAWISNHFAFSV